PLGETKYHHNYNKFDQSILNHEYCITGRDGKQHVGIIHSSGDGNINHYIAEIVLHAGHPTPRIGSKQLEAYLTAAAEVSKIYILSHAHYRTTFSKTWLQYKGFRLIAENGDIIVYMLDRGIKY